MSKARKTRLLAVVTALTAGGAVAAGLTASQAAVPAAAPAGTTVVVHGTAFPDPSKAQLSFVGCSNLYQRTSQAVQPMVGQGPGSAPSGDRSLAFDLPGGDAVGARFDVASVLSTTVAGVMVHADGGTATGVAYVGYQAPGDAGTQRLWLGRADLSTPGGAWQTVDVVGRDFTWSQWDMSTHQQLQAAAGQPATVADFAAAHGGDGPGLFTVGFGCNGVPFNTDDFRVGGPSGTTTYDLEGLTTSVSMHAGDPGADGTTLRGSLATDTGDAVPGATLLLEQATSADGPWKPADAVPVTGGAATTTVSPDQRTWYRWRFVDRPLAAGSVSSVVVVDGTDDGPSASASPTGKASSGPTGKPSTEPSTGPTSQPSSGPSTGPTTEPTAGPTAGPSPGPTTGPSAGPTDKPTDSATGGASSGPTDGPTTDGAGSASSGSSSSTEPGAGASTDSTGGSGA